LRSLPIQLCCTTTHFENGQYLKTIITIGSGNDCDIQYTGRYIEPKHAQLELRSDKWVIVDLSKKFGVTINSDRITEPTVLNDHSHVKVGTQVLHWRDEVSDVLHPKPRRYNHFDLQDFFLWEGEMKRKPYAAFLVVIAVAHLFVLVFGTWLGNFLATAFSLGALSELQAYFTPCVWTIGFLVLWYAIVIQTVKRVFESGLPGWKFLIPVYNVYLLLFK